MDTDKVIDEALDKPKRVYRTKRRHKRQPKEAAAPFVAPAEFAGMTARNCCDACAKDPVAQEAAQMRLHEIDRMYPRIESRNPRSETVLESDAEWLARNSQVNAEEWRKLWRKAKGECAISGAAACGHPFKGVKPRTADGLERWGRAAKALAHQKIELKGNA